MVPILKAFVWLEIIFGECVAVLGRISLYYHTVKEMKPSQVINRFRIPNWKKAARHLVCL